MFRFSFFICLAFFGFSAFGEKAQEQNNITPVEKAQTKTVEVSDPSVETKEPDLPTEMGQNLTESTTSWETLKKYRKSLRLEWAGGLGITDSTFFMPLTLEIKGLMMKTGNKELRWLFQGGGILMGRRRFLAVKDTGLTHILQTGLQYHFTKTLYGSLKGGAIQALEGDRIWIVGLASGFAINNTFTLEMGFQFFYPDENEIDLGAMISVGSAIKSW